MRTLVTLILPQLPPPGAEPPAIRYSEHMRTWLMAAGVAGALAAAPAAQVRPPANCEVRTFTDTFDNTTSKSLTLSLAGPTGAIPISTALTAVQQSVGGPPRIIRFDLDYTLHTGLPSFRLPHLLFTLDRDTKDRVEKTLRVNPNVPLESTKRVSIPITISDLRAIARAKTVDGRLFGLDFVLTPTQRGCLRDFVAGL